MRIGFLTDGKSEVQCLPLLFEELSRITDHTFVGPVILKSSAADPVSEFVSECRRKSPLLPRPRPDKIVILLDREQQQICPGQLAIERERALIAEIGDTPIVSIVIKDQKFENWLIADVDALLQQTSRFNRAQLNTLRRKVERRGADGLDAENKLDVAASDHVYRKVRDSHNILKRANIATIERHSRSFRCLLQRVGHPDYPDHSRRAARND